MGFETAIAFDCEHAARQGNSVQIEANVLMVLLIKLSKDDWALNGTSLTFLQALVIYFCSKFFLRNSCQSESQFISLGNFKVCLLMSFLINNQKMNNHRTLNKRRLSYVKSIWFPSIKWLCVLLTNYHFIPFLISILNVFNLNQKEEHHYKVEKQLCFHCQIEVSKCKIFWSAVLSVNSKDSLTACH